MEALFAVLSAIKAPGEGVASLLACLPSEDFALDVHICSYGEARPAPRMNLLVRPAHLPHDHTVCALCTRHSPSRFPIIRGGTWVGGWVWALG